MFERQTMAEDNSPIFSLSRDEGMHLDSTKRCLFPAVGESSISRSDSIEMQSGSIDSPSKTVDSSDKENRNSPISVVCVLPGGNPKLDSDRDQNFEEQTVIEVRYVEPEHQNCAMDAVENSRENRNEHVPNRKKNFGSAMDSVKNVPCDLGDVRAKPLLDIDKTPSRSQTKKKRYATQSPMFSCGGRGACFAVCDDNDHQLVEKTITNFLEEGSTSTPDAFKTSCHDWQAWSYFGFGGSHSSTNSVETSPSKENIRSVLRRRTSHSLRVRKSNVRQLKQNLAPFAKSPARSPARAPGLFRNRSFSVSDHRSAIVRVSKDKKRGRGSFTDVLQLCTMYESIELESPDLVRKRTNYNRDDDDLSYDSDPEDFTRRRLRSSVATGELMDLEHMSSSHSSPSRSLLDVHNDEAFATIVQEIFNKTTTLVLHPLSSSNKTGSVQSARPIAVDAWLERGQNLAYALIQPKWLWKAKPRLDSESQSNNVCQKFCLQGIELLDITRILKMDETESFSQPFAKPSHCFIIKSIHDEEFCFEAKSRSERDRVVSSLKLLIARFGAKVLTGDPQVYYEFFWMNEAAPGKAPNLQDVFENVDDIR